MQPNEALAQDVLGDVTGALEKMNLRRHPSVDKNGNTGTSEANQVSNVGMGWFPGYAIDVATGERLNMAFGEDSWLSADNGKGHDLEPVVRPRVHGWTALDLRLQKRPCPFRS